MLAFLLLQLGAACVRFLLLYSVLLPIAGYNAIGEFAVQRDVHRACMSRLPLTGRSEPLDVIVLSDASADRSRVSRADG